MLDSLTDEEWHDIDRILGDALERPPDERSAYLDDACADAVIRAAVEELLEVSTSGRTFLDGEVIAFAQPAVPVDEAEVPGDLPTASTDLPGSPKDLGGRRVGPYRLLEPAGRGGMSRVYRAERADGAFEQEVAVKVLPVGLDTEAARKRFRVERQVLADLRHPGIANLLDGGVTDENVPYLVLEYVEGEPITDYCDVRHLSVEERIGLLLQVAEVLQFAHRNLTVHRDVKPANVLVTEVEGAQQPRVKLLDFGIAKLLGDHPSPVLATQTGYRPMTPAYAAPEQVRGTSISALTDVYQFGVLTYEVLSGYRPFDDCTHVFDVEQAVLDREPQPASCAAQGASSSNAEEKLASPEEVAERRGTTAPALQRSLQGDLDTILQKSLEKEPERRFRSVDVMAADFRRHLQGKPIQARPTPPLVRATKFARRHRGAVAAASGVVFLIAVFLGLLVQERNQAQREARKAQQVSGFLVELMQAGNPYSSTHAEGTDMTVGTVLERGAERIDRLDGQPEVQAEMRSVIGTAYLELGGFAEARPLLTQALEQQTRLTTAPDSSTATILHRLALLAQETGDPQTADSLSRRALQIRIRILGPDHPQTAGSLRFLGNLQWYHLGRYREADSMLSRSLQIQQAAYDGPHADVASSLNDLANLHHRRGEHEAAAGYYRRAIAMYKDVMGQHPSVAIIQNNYAYLLRERGRYAEAEQVQREALVIHRDRVGEESLDAALGTENLGRILMYRGKIDAADSLITRGRDLLSRIYEPPHPYTARSNVHTGHLRIRQERWGAAQRRFEEALRQMDAVLPPGHPERSGALLGLARVQLALNAPDEAEPLLQKSLALRTDAFGSDNWRVAEVQTVLGRCLALQGRPEKSRQLLAASVKTLHSKPTGGRLLERARTYQAALTDETLAGVPR